MASRKAIAEAPEPIRERMVDEVSDRVQEALVSLSGALTAASAVVEICQSENSSMTWQVVMKRYNALEFLIRQASLAEDQVWAAIDDMDAGEAA